MALPFEGVEEEAEVSDVYAARLADWRCNQVVYQVMPDRFAPSADRAAMASHYTAPRRLRGWDERPQKGTFLPDERVWSHEIDFWGGTLTSVTAHLDHLVSMGVNVLYLTPIFHAFTNHKYDTIDYFTIDPALGTQADFEKLCAQAHRQNIRVVLDGVFNHVGERNAWFQEARRDAESRYRRFFAFDNNLTHGYLCWSGAPSLPELDIGEQPVRDMLWASPHAVVPHWLKHADGWRLDVAFDLGPDALSELTAAAHRARPDALITGEIYNEPSGWLETMDGVLNMYLGRLILELASGHLPPRQMQALVAALVEDAGIEGLLRSWIVLSNHDRPRLRTALPDLQRRAFALALQATLPGAPQYYYGEEIGLEGGDDPEQRGPMDWNAVRAGSAPELALTRRVIALRHTHRALQVGDYQPVAAQQLFAFTRRTGSVRDLVLVVANPTDHPVSELLGPRDPWLMDGTPMDDALGGKPTRAHMGLVQVTVPPLTVQAFVPRIGAAPGYDRYKRVP